jgi:hypothetical protein
MKGITLATARFSRRRSTAGIEIAFFLNTHHRLAEKLSFVKIDGS